MSLAETRETLRALVHNSGLCLDEGRFDEFVALFADDGTYRMIAATPELGATQTWLAFDREEMARHFAAIPEHHWPPGEMTRIVSVDAITCEDGEASTVATFCILRNDDEGRTTCYAVGRYRDRWRMDGIDWRIAERVVDLRTRLLPAPAPIPL